VKRWKAGKRDWRSWVVGSAFIALLLVQLLTVPHAVLAATTFDVTVAPVNVAPSFTKGTNQTVLEDCGSQTVSEWATSMSAGPADEAGQTLDFVVTNDNNALFSAQPTVAANGTLTYMPAINGNGMATVTVSLHDNGGTADGGVNTSTPQTFTITVTPVNDAPVIAEGATTSVIMDEDSYPAPFGLMLQATDADGDSLTWSILTQPLRGTAAATGTGASKVITYIPTANYNGPDSFVVRVSDGYGGIADIAVNVTVRPRNDPPVSIVASQISGTPHPGYSLSTTNGTWDDSVDSPTTVFTYGYRWQSSADGGLTWINVFGATNPTYTMQASDVGKVLRCVVTCLDKLSRVQPDQSAQSYSNLVRVVNQAPIIAEGATTSVIMDEDASPTPFSLALHATDADSDTLTWNILTQPLRGTAAATGTGAFKVITYIPTANYNGPDSFVVRVSDGYGGIADIAVNVTVNPINDTPSFTGSADQMVLENCGPKTIAGWATNVSAGPSNESGQTLKFNVTNSNNSLFAVQPAIAANGTLTYTPAANMNGTATVTVRIHDDGGTASGGVDTSVAQTFTITVTVVNDPPVDTYTLTYTAGANGTISGATSQTVNHGASGTSVTAVPQAGYHFVSWSDGSTVNPRTDTNVTADITVTASFAVDTFAITASAGANGSIDPSGSMSVNYGSIQSFTINPSAGYHVLDVLVDGGSLGAVTSYTFTNLTENHTIAVTFAINPITISTYTVTYTAGANGTISGTSPQTVNEGASGTAVTATPDAGYHFVSWSDGIFTAARTDTNVTVNVNASTSFAINTYTIVASAGANGAIDPSGSMSVNYGSTQSFTINPSTGYHVQDVLVDGSSVGAVTTYTFTNVIANHTIAASFGINSYVLTADTSGSGSISKSPDQTSYGHGISIQLTATPATYWHFVGWSGDLTGSGNPVTVTIDGNKTITATFAIDTFTVTPSAGSNGSILPATVQTVDYDGSLTFIMTPTTGYHVLDVFVDTVSVGTVTSYTFTNLTENHTIAVTFAINPITISTYTVTYTAGANGTISGTSPQTVNQGANGTSVTAVPQAGYHFVSWSDGSLTAARTDTNVTANINATSSFAVDTFAITVISGSHGTATPGTGLLPCHAVQAYVVKPDAGYMVDTLTVDGVVVNEATNRLGYTVTLISIEAPHTIVATFASIPDLTAPVDDVPSFTKGPDQTVLEDCGLQTVAGWATSISAGPADEAGQAIDFIVTNDNTTLFSMQPAVAANGTLTFTPAADASGTAIVTLALTDDATAGSSALTTASQSFTITVTKVADILDDTATILDDTAVTSHVPANDNFEDTNRHVRAFTPPSHGAGVINAGSTIDNTPVAPFPVSPRHTMVLTIDIKTMTVDSARVVLDAPAAIVEDRTLVPLRAVVEHLGGSIAWDAKTRQVTLKARGTTITLTIGKSTALVNGKLLAIDPKNSKVVPVLSSNRTMLPLRFVSENLGLQVGWDAETRTITVNWED